MKKVAKAVFSLFLFLGVTGFGIPVGVAVYTFYYAEGHAYLTDDPKACLNCHVMKPHFDGWNQSTHRAVAKCNDCHAPNGFFGKYFAKAVNGFNHSWAFTAQNFKEPIRINDWNLKITENACLNCHREFTENKHGSTLNLELKCTSCHKGVGHSL